jgi:peptide/nickel transport system permease protein
MSAKFLLGTDNLGRDLLSRMIYGARTTIFIAVLATALSFILGSILGFTAAVSAAGSTQIMSRFVDLLMAIPTLIFGLVVLSVLPSTLVTLILVMGILDSTRVYRLSRAVAVDINVMDFVEAAKLRGEGTRWIIFREILPNALSPLVSELGLRFIYAVLFLSALSFLGLGVQPPEADWGGMVKENKDGIVFGIPAALIPAGAIAALAISVNLVADWVLNRTTEPQGRARQWLKTPARKPPDGKLLDIRNLKIEATVYPPGEDPRMITIVDGVSLTLQKGKVLGLIGESGAGKSTIGLSSMAYGRGGVRITGGEVILNGRDILKAGKTASASCAASEVCYVAQSAAAAFNPAHRLMDQVVEACCLHGTASAPRPKSARCAVQQAQPAQSREPSASAIRTRSPAASCSA